MAKKAKAATKPLTVNERELARAREERRAVERITREQKRIRQAIGIFRRANAATTAALRELYEDLEDRFGEGQMPSGGADAERV